MEYIINFCFNPKFIFKTNYSFSCNGRPLDLEKKKKHVTSSYGLGASELHCTAIYSQQYSHKQTHLHHRVLEIRVLQMLSLLCRNRCDEEYYKSIACWLICYNHKASSKMNYILVRIH